MVLGGEDTNITGSIASVVGTGAGPITVTTSGSFAHGPAVGSVGTVTITNVTGFANAGNGNFNINKGFTFTVTGTNTFTLNRHGWHRRNRRPEHRNLYGYRDQYGRNLHAADHVQRHRQLDEHRPLPPDPVRRRESGVDERRHGPGRRPERRQYLAIQPDVRRTPGRLTPACPAARQPHQCRDRLDQAARRQHRELRSFTGFANDAPQTGGRFVPGATIARTSGSPAGSVPIPLGATGGAASSRRWAPASCCPTAACSISAPTAIRRCTRRRPWRVTRRAPGWPAPSFPTATAPPTRPPR